MKPRKFYTGEVLHVYQRTRGLGLLFYDIKDYLVFFTVFCSYARKKDVKVLALCPMPDHIHQVIMAEDARQLADFIQQYTRVFSFEWNRARGRKGPLFHHPFGSAGKEGNKKVRTALAYCNNNPVERKLTLRAEEYRWTFLARYPRERSRKRIVAGAKAQAVFREVQKLCDEGDYVRYGQLDRWERQLTETAWLQLADYIIDLWNVIDYEQAAGYYGSWDAMLDSFAHNTGSECDIREEHNPYSDAVYADCLKVLGEEGEDLRGLPMLPSWKKEKLYGLLEKQTRARPRQIRKILHMRP